MIGTVTSRTVAAPSRLKARLAFFGAVAALAFPALAACFLLYAKTLNVGFLLDDFWHIDYLYRAFHGQPQALVAHVLGGWSLTTDGLACYRPGTSLALALDYAFFGNNPAGFHLTNLFLLAANCLLVGLLGWQLTAGIAPDAQSPGSAGIRPAFVAAAAAALFACYPLHVESVAWVIGRVDLLCTMFYLASMCAYLRFREGGAPLWFIAAPIFFLLALACKEPAVTLPVVLSVFEVLAARRHAAAGLETAGATPCIARARRIYLLVTTFAVLAGFAVWRTHVLGTLVGGYGGVNKHALRQGVRNLVDARTWLKVIVPITDEYGAPSIWQFYGCAAAFVTACGAAAVASWRLRSSGIHRLFAFLLAWLLIGILPAFQIWHVFPNLLGSRLFFLSSAPFCLFLALSANTLALPRAACVAVVSAIVLLWGSCVHTNLQPWLEAGLRLGALKTQAQSLLSKAAPGRTVLLANLPADYKGAGMVGRPEYLALMCNPPQSATKLSDRLATCERTLPGPHEFVSPAQLSQSSRSSASAFAWSEAQSRFIRLVAGSQQKTAAISKFTREDGVYWFETGSVNPLSAQAVEVTLAPSAGQAVRLVWRTPEQPWWLCTDNPAALEDGKLLFVPSRLRSWTFGGHLTKIGVQSSTPVAAAAIYGAGQVEPAVSLLGHRLVVDAAAVPRAHSVRVYVSLPGKPFPDLAQPRPPAPDTISWSKDTGTTAALEVPQAKAVSQVCALALDADGKPVGVLSAPLTLAP